MTRLTGEERNALSALRFEWTLAPDDVWAPQLDHVRDLNRSTARKLRSGVANAEASKGASPLGLVVEGDKGTGKTHLLGWLRAEVQRDDGYFFLVGLTRAEDFWANVIEGLLDGLFRSAPGGSSQLDIFLTRLARIAGTAGALQRTLTAQPNRTALDKFVTGLGKGGANLGPEVNDTARALALYGSLDPAPSVARGWLVASPDQDLDELRHWGIRGARPIERIVQDIFRLLAATGHSVLAIDQIDPLIANAAASPQTVAVQAEDEGRDDAAQQVAQGVMLLRDLTRRTLTVLACHPNTWHLLSTRTAAPVRDRFRPPLSLKAIDRQEVATQLVAKRFTTQYREAGFTPPHPTWPISRQALAGAVNYTPRALLQRIEKHVEHCLETETVSELDDLSVTQPQTSSSPLEIDRPDLQRLDRRFQELQGQADVRRASDQHADDGFGPPLLAAALQSWVLEQGDRAPSYSLDAPPGPKPSLHARIRLTVDEETETETHWAFRLLNTQHAYSALTKLRTAVQASAFKKGDPTRNLVVLRNVEWSTGPKTRTETARFVKDGGTIADLTDEDVRVFHALQVMFGERDPLLRTWVRARRPTSGTVLFQKTLPAETAQSPPVPTAAPGPDGPSSPTRVPVGRTIGDGAVPVDLDLASLRKHIAVFAGTGSGKTVLLRRIIEECALRGVSSIVLDPNDDLARLGDPWPDPPPDWGPGDAARAAEFMNTCEVVVWTPLRTSGRPLTFQPLPDFSSVLDDVDEFQQAVDMAVSALATRVKADGSTRRAEIQRAVLKQSVEFFARHGGGRLHELVPMLADLPDEASDLDQAGRWAAEMAQTLRAAMVNDPLFGGAGTAVDPARLLTPAEGRRARISVINLIGLSGDLQRQRFISQLQMALFGWFKKNPARDVPLGGLLIMDEAQTVVPSGALTPSTQSTLALASQARKYGLGLVFATQAPKGLHNRIPGNASTQFYGRLNAPSQIQTARELARVMGGDVADVGALTAGQFYVVGEGRPFVKIRTPLSLSYHGNPLSPEEVLDRARGEVSA